ncbi:MAG: replication restart helicase PriA, partial [bacterium]
MSEAKAEIIVPKSGLDYALTYLVPEVFLNLLQIGAPVIVPLKSRKTYGFISSINSAYPSKSANLKKIISISKNSFFNQNHLNFYNWLASYYHESIARVLDAALPSIDAKNFHLLDIYAEYNNKNNKNLNKSNIGSNASKGNNKNSNNSNNNNYTAVSVISSIISPSISSLIPYSAISITDPADYLKLTEDQLKAIETIKEPIKENFYKTFLLHGVTASGKTEIYLNLLEYTLSLNKQVIIIVPEIYITNQFIDIMKKRFSKMLNPHEFAIFHSKIAKKEKLINWFKILSGEIKIVLGARSAIFAPLIKPGLIIVDEEHDSSYKQESEFLYNARDIAVMLAKKSNSVAVLGSATPSLESFYNAKTIKKYEYINIKERVSGRSLPEIKIIDLKNEFKSNNLNNNNKNINFSDEMLSEISRNETIENVNQKRQVLLFLNRRGFSTFIICKSCGHQFICKNCAVSMVYHKGKNYEKSFLKCHYCNYTEEVPKLCPE